MPIHPPAYSSDTATRTGRTTGQQAARGGVAVVMGASRGLGLLVSQDLLRRGFIVYGCARDEDELQGAARLLAAAVPGSQFVARVCDVREEAAVLAVVEEVVDTHGRLDVALHVAGVIQVGHADTVTLGHYHEAVDTMLWGPVHLALASVPHMRDAGHGRIGIVSSVGGLVAVPRLVPYSVAKFGAVGLAEGLYAELSGTGVTVTAVTPGLMRTGGHTHARFVDDAVSDYAWFAPLASLPGLSISAERAARRIVSGVLSGRPTVELTPLTIIGRRVHGLAPATTVRVMGLMGRLLPGPSGRAPDPMAGTAPGVDGSTARARLSSRVVDGLTVLGDRAARRTNEVGPRDVSSTSGSQGRTDP
jgi:NAD(P)-dependent dehydrogenase (short-subunit alcohol dehydrogenase family)